jgi:hypothetical protein
MACPDHRPHPRRPACDDPRQRQGRSSSLRYGRSTMTLTRVIVTGLQRGAGPILPIPTTRLTGGPSTDKGAADPAGEAAQIAMDHHLPLTLVCRVLGAPRSSISARRVRSSAVARPGPTGSISDSDLLSLIGQVLLACPFAGEGYRKVRARLRREHTVHVSGKRILRLLRQEGLLAPQRVRGRRTPRPHDGTIIPEAPNQRWGTDATMAWTRTDGWVWMGVDLCLHRPLHGRGLGPCGQGRRPVRRLAAGRRRRHRALGPPGRRRGPRAGAAPRLGAPIPLGALHRLPGLAGHQR